MQLDIRYDKVDALVNLFIHTNNWIRAICTSKSHYILIQTAAPNPNLSWLFFTQKNLLWLFFVLVKRGNFTNIIYLHLKVWISLIEFLQHLELVKQQEKCLKLSYMVNNIYLWITNCFIVFRGIKYMTKIAPCTSMVYYSLATYTGYCRKLQFWNES